MQSFKEFVLFNEDANSKIKKYLIHDPYVKRFLHQGGENLIDWNKINFSPTNSTQNLQSVQDQIAILVNNVKYRLTRDSKKSVLVPDDIIDVDRDLEIARVAHPDQYPDLVKLVDQEGKEAVAKKLAHVINMDKVKMFKSWIKGVEEETTTYNNENPAAQYLLLKPVFDSSTKKDKTPPKPFNGTALSFVLNKIKAEESNPDTKNRSSVIRLYNNFLSNFAQAKLKNIPTASGKSWIVVPSIEEDPINFERNVELLMSISCKIWCIAGKTMAESYLKKGNFYMLAESQTANSKGLIAVRLIGDNIAEIRGTLESQNFSTEYVKDILELAEKEGFKKSQVLKWVHKQERREGKDLTQNEDTGSWQDDMKKQIFEKVAGDGFERYDPRQGQFDFAVRMRTDTERLMEETVQRFFDQTGLKFSAIEPAFVFGDPRSMEEIGELLDDQGFNYMVNLQEGNEYVEASDGDYDTDLAEELFMEDIDVDTETEYFIELLKEKNFTKEQIEEELDDFTPDDDGFKRIEHKFGFEFTSGEQPDERWSRAIWATLDGARAGIETKMFEMMQEHIQENFIPIGEYWDDDGIEIPIEEDVVLGGIMDEYLEDKDEFVIDDADQLKEYMGDYDVFDPDDAHWNYEIDKDRAREAFESY